MTKMIAIDHAVSADRSVGTHRSVESRSASAALRNFAWFVLVYNVIVILWGAVVRATGSGAGCGDQWPLCDGAAIPQSPQFHTMVEFTHRMMSGGALILILALLVWTWRATAKGHLARWTAGIALVLVLNEAFLGALLVTVASHSASVATGVLLFSCHLTNTLLLVAALALTAEFLSNPRFGATSRPRRGRLSVSEPGHPGDAARRCNGFAGGVGRYDVSVRFSDGCDSTGFFRDGSLTSSPAMDTPGKRLRRWSIHPVAVGTRLPPRCSRKDARPRYGCASNVAPAIPARRIGRGGATANMVADPSSAGRKCVLDFPGFINCKLLFGSEVIRINPGNLTRAVETVEANV